MGVRSKKIRSNIRDIATLCKILKICISMLLGKSLWYNHFCVTTNFSYFSREKNTNFD